MVNLRQDGTHFLIGITVTLAVLGAVGTIVGILLLLLLIVAPGQIVDTLQNKIGNVLQGGLFVVAMFEAIGWHLLQRVGFVSPRLGQRMTVTMSTLALFMFMMVLFSL